MNTTNARPVQLPALIDGRYRVVTVEHLPYGTLPAYPEGPALVTVGAWCVSSASLSPLSSPSVLAADDGRITLNVYKMTGAVERHPLDGTKYDTQQDADRAAYDAGVSGYLVYEHMRATLGVRFRVTNHRDAAGNWCRASLCDVVPPEQRKTDADRCPAGCPDGRVEMYHDPNPAA